MVWWLRITRCTCSCSESFFAAFQSKPKKFLCFRSTESHTELHWLCCSCNAIFSKLNSYFPSLSHFRCLGFFFFLNTKLRVTNWFSQCLFGLGAGRVSRFSVRFHHLTHSAGHVAVLSFVSYLTPLYRFITSIFFRLLTHLYCYCTNVVALPVCFAHAFHRRTGSPLS